ncbi:glycosyltransferase family 2 protein [Candidatus Amoebophilus asiaticus]|nr:glycosyltransferase family 2 protein [Candidatus Amoebophilus asiaticus]
MAKISAVIITFNEERNISRCIESVMRVADEVLVVDSFSSDNTKAICEALKVRFVQNQWEGYSRQKNYGNSIASHDYILSLDADEVLSEELINSIIREKANLEGAYQFNRLNNYCGKWIKHCGWYPDKKLRLFKRDEAHWKGDYVHETIQLKSGTKIKHLHGDLYHFSFSSVNDHLMRINKYATLAGKELSAKNNAIILSLKMIFSPPVKFINSYFINLGFLDGYFGIMICTLVSYEVFTKNLRAILLKVKSD